MSNLITNSIKKSCLTLCSLSILAFANNNISASSVSGSDWDIKALLQEGW